MKSDRFLSREFLLWIKNKLWTKAPEFDVSLAKYTSFRNAGTALSVVSPCTQQELSELIKYLECNAIPYIYLGKGSNVLFCDDLFLGVIIKLDGQFKEHQFYKDKLYVCCGAAGSNTAVAQKARKLHYSGLEFLITIPGSIGGGVFMNAGAYGKDFSQIVQQVQYMDIHGEVHILSNENINFCYRSSLFHSSKSIITQAKLRIIPKEDNRGIIEQENTYIHSRVSTQPIYQCSFGSIFKNPLPEKAAKLIEDCQLKGKKFGNVQISDKHANFLVNKGNASFQDIKNAITTIQNTVLQKFNIRLQTEVRIFNAYGQLTKYAF